MSEPLTPLPESQELTGSGELNRQEAITVGALPTGQSVVVEGNSGVLDIVKYRDYVEVDKLSPSPLPKMVDIDASDRDIPIQTQTGEVVTESEYISRFMEDMKDNPEFRSKMQWMGEKELVGALAEQAKWLVGRVLSGERVLVIDETWNRKGNKSGSFISDLVVAVAKEGLSQQGINSSGMIILDEQAGENDIVVADRAVIFDDWISSGHDMGQRVSWATKFMQKHGMAEDKLTINLLVAQTSILKNGFDKKNVGYRTDTSLEVISPFAIEIEDMYHWYAPFSGIHSDTDYSFTEKEEMRGAIKKRRKNEYGVVSSYHIESKDTLGDPDFYRRIKDKVNQRIVA